MEAYCMKCRAKREIKNARSIVMKNGRPATQGVCPVCGTKMFRMGRTSVATRPSGGGAIRSGPPFRIPKYRGGRNWRRH